MTKALAKMNLNDGAGFEKEFQNLAIDGDMIDKIEYIRNDGTSLIVKKKEVEWLEPKDDESEDDEDQDEDEDEQSDENWDWIQPHIKDDREKFDNETYFCMINFDRQP